MGATTSTRTDDPSPDAAAQRHRGLEDNAQDGLASVQAASAINASAIYVDGGARDPKVPTLFKVADVDSGVIRWVCADLVTHIVPRS